MSDKKSPIQLYSNSQIPKDLLVPTLGSNYGMDGFEDMEYGMGVLEGVLNPEYHKPPALPTGLNKGADMDLSAVMADESGLADLSWLADAVQDPERLPVSPVDLSIPELEEAWGVDRRTNGVQVFAELDGARYKASLNDEAPRLTRTSAELESIVVRAMHRSALGQSLKEILIEAAAKAGADSHRIAKAMRMIHDEHGLAGNVFIRAAAFPGIAKGKWSSESRRATKGARYVVVSERDFGSTRIQAGNCTLTGKKAVLTIPWDEALQHYRPLLRVSGRNPEGATAKNALRSAFLKGDSTPKADGSSLPVYIVKDTVSASEAASKLRQASASRSVVEISEAHVRTRIAAWEVSGMLSPGIAHGILNSGRTPNQKMDAALLVVQAVQKKAFSGASNNAADAAQDRQASRLDSVTRATEAREAKLHRVAAVRRSDELDARIAKVIDQIDRGARGAHLREIINRLIPRDQAPEAVRRLAPAIKKANALDSRTETTSYSGTVFERAQFEKESVALTVSEAIVKAASDAGVQVAEVKGILRWAGQNMSEGFAGKELQDLLDHRFSKRVLGAASGLIAELRERHEGLAGFMYVDAEAYATSSGVAGCEKGATRHRANRIPSVLEMSRCASCTLSRTMEDGTRKCGTYNKQLVSPETIAEPEIQQIREANIRSTEMTDAERTASIFTDSSMYDPAEYNLRNAELTDLTLESFAETDTISQVSFGGLRWE
jgi:hypothetical protein